MSELMQRVKDLLNLKHYTIEDFIKDANPQTNYELELLEKHWSRYANKKEFGTVY